MASRAAGAGAGVGQKVRDLLNAPWDGPGRYATSTVAAAKTIGELLGERAHNEGVSAVYWQRPGRYHGKIKAFVDAVREAGVQTFTPPPPEMPAAPKKVPGVP